jgi:hypothetical protein
VAAKGTTVVYEKPAFSSLASSLPSPFPCMLAQNVPRHLRMRLGSCQGILMRTHTVVGLASS